MERNPKTVAVVLVGIAVALVGIILTVAFMERPSVMAVGIVLAVLGAGGIFFGCINYYGQRDDGFDDERVYGDDVGPQGIAPRRIPPRNDDGYGWEHDAYRRGSAGGGHFDDGSEGFEGDGPLAYPRSSQPSLYNIDDAYATTEDFDMRNEPASRRAVILSPPPRGTVDSDLYDRGGAQYAYPSSARPRVVYTASERLPY